MKTTLHRLPLALALGLAMFALDAQALGLGQIQVKSGLSQPLLAEIPVLSSTPGELDGVSVRMAAPEAFSRAGLEPPRGMAANLVFNLVVAQDGSAVIRVTTPGKVNDPFVSFLVEVEWESGKLLREFTVLLDPPYLAPAVQPAVAPARSAVAAPPPPPPPPPPAPAVPAPEPLPAPEIAQVPEPPRAAPEPLREAPAQPQPLPAAQAPAAPVQVAPAPPPPAPPAPPARPAEPAAAVQPAPAPAAPEAAVPESVEVAAGQTLWGIASRTRPAGASMNQAMTAILRANERAFIGGNMNLLKRGEVLRIPPAEQMRTLSRSQSDALVREQTEAWQAGLHRAVPQPAAEPAPAVAGPRAPRRPPAASGGAGPRLEVVPPDAEAVAGAAQSGTRAGGSGRRIDASPEPADVAAAATQADQAADLQVRVQQLEKVQDRSKRLLQIREEEIARLKAQVEASERAQAQAQAEAASARGETPWYQRSWSLLGAGLLAGGLIAFLLGRRGRPGPAPEPASTARKRNYLGLFGEHRPPEAAPKAGAAPAAKGPTERSEGAAGEARVAAPRPIRTGMARAQDASAPGRPAEAAPAAPEPAPASPAEPAAKPAKPGVVPAFVRQAERPATAEDVAEAAFDWSPEGSTLPAPVDSPAPTPRDDALDWAPESQPQAAWLEAVDERDGGPEPAPAEPRGAGDDAVATKLELARAYLDIGDSEGARALLEEVIGEGGADLRARAQALLDEIE